MDLMGFARELLDLAVVVGSGGFAVVVDFAVGDSLRYFVLYLALLVRTPPRPA